MFTRIVMLMLIAVLALPVATLTRPAETSPSSWSQSAVAAKGKHHKKKDKKRKDKIDTRTVRQPVTQTFTSTVPLTIPTGAPGTEKGPANPYPATIEVSGFSNGAITDVNLILTDFTHTTAQDVDILLSTSDGRQALVMSDVEPKSGVVDIDLTLDDEAAAVMPAPPAPGQGIELQSGTYRPVDYDLGPLYVFPDTFAAPAPAPNGTVALSTFDGVDPNGTWQLWVMDQGDTDSGDLGGWALQITAEVDVQVQERVKAKKKGKGHKKGRR